MDTKDISSFVGVVATLMIAGTTSVFAQEAPTECQSDSSTGLEACLFGCDVGGFACQFVTETCETGCSVAAAGCLLSCLDDDDCLEQCQEELAGCYDGCDEVSEECYQACEQSCVSDHGYCDPEGTPWFVDAATEGNEYGTLSDPFLSLLDVLFEADASETSTVYIEPGTYEALPLLYYIDQPMWLINNDPSAGSVLIE